jgi:hypothetical protein
MSSKKSTKAAGKRKAKPLEFQLQVISDALVSFQRQLAALSAKRVNDEEILKQAMERNEAIIKLATNGRILLVPGRCDAALVLTRPLSSEPMGCGKLGHVDYETHLCLYCLEMKRGYDGKLAKGRQFGPAHLSHLSPGCPDPWHKERGMVNSPLQCPSCRSFVWDKTGLPGETKEAAQ